MSSSLRLRLPIYVLLLWFAWPFPARAAGRVECRALSSRILGRAVRYCVLLPPSYDAEKARRYPVLYYLHGLGDNEQSLVNFGGWNLMAHLQEQGRLGEFLIVAPDGGRTFYVNSRDGRERYEDFFIREFLPLMDKNYRTRADRAFRGITGFSMGGYGALRFAFLYPRLFRSASAHSPALMERMPRMDFVASPVERSRFHLLGEVFGSPPDSVFWDQQNPLTLARQQSGLSDLKIYFDCGSEDRYGFDAGARKLHDVLRARGVAHEFHIYPGGHDALYLAEHLPASFEFHSRVFGFRAGRFPGVSEPTKK